MQHIDIYDIPSGYLKAARCVGHSSTVTHIDWAKDSSILMSNDQAYELLYFDPKNGKQVKANQRDTAWATWTCELMNDGLRPCSSLSGTQPQGILFPGQKTKFVPQLCLDLT